MTTTELKNLIKTKLEGQGNQIDIGNALADILNELVEPTPLVFGNFSSFGNKTSSEAATILGITSEELIGVVNGEYKVITIPELGDFMYMGGIISNHGREATFAGEGVLEGGMFAAYAIIGVRDGLYYGDCGEN